MKIKYIFFIVKVLSFSLSCYTIVNPHVETAQRLISFQQDDVTSELDKAAGSGVKCLQYITKYFFQQTIVIGRTSNLVMTIAHNLSGTAHKIQQDYLKIMMEKVNRQSELNSNETFQLRILSDSKPYKGIVLDKSRLVRVDFYLLIVDSVSLYRKFILNYIKLAISYNPAARILILYYNLNETHLEKQKTMGILKDCLDLLYSPNVAILFATSATRFSFTLMDYYNKTACLQVQMQPFGSCENGTVFDMGTSLEYWRRHVTRLNYESSSKLSKNCSLKLCCSISPPFIEKDCVLGLEFNLLNTISSYYDFGINSSCSIENRGVEFPEGSDEWSGLLGEIKNKNCDFIMGGFFPDNDVSNAFWASVPYLEDSYAWFVDRAETRPAWMALYILFKNETWIAVVVILVITWLIWSLLVNFEHGEPENSKQLSLTGLNSLGVSLCCSVHDRPVCPASRIFFFVLAIYGLNLTSHYTSKLVDVLRNPGVLPQISTIAEAIAAGIPYGGPEEYYDWFNNSQDEWILPAYNYSSDFYVNNENLKRVSQGKRIILASRYTVQQSAFLDDVAGFDYNIFMSGVQMITRRGFPFLSEFNRLIIRFRDAGLFVKIKSEFEFNNTILNRLVKNRIIEPAKVIVLTTDHLQGAFAVFIVGVIASSLAFLFELVTYLIVKPCCRRYNCQCCKTKKQQKSFRKSKTSKNQKKRKLNDQRQNRKTKKPKSFRSTDSAILLAWGEQDISNDPNIPKGIRYTPLNRRIIIMSAAPEKKSN